MSETTISVVSSKSLLTLFGARDQHVRKIRDALGVNITVQDGRIQIDGPPEAVASATEVLERLESHAIGMAAGAEDYLGFPRLNGHSPLETRPSIFKPGRDSAQSPGQARFWMPFVKHLCFVRRRERERRISQWPWRLGAKGICPQIVLVRPAVEAGKVLAICPATPRPRSIPICAYDGRLAR
jgi:phosphate starvation-inducible PhoH-like protein